MTQGTERVSMGREGLQPQSASPGPFWQQNEWMGGRGGEHRPPAAQDPVILRGPRETHLIFSGGNVSPCPWAGDALPFDPAALLVGVHHRPRAQRRRDTLPCISNRDTFRPPNIHSSKRPWRHAMDGFHRGVRGTRAGDKRRSRLSPSL